MKNRKKNDSDFKTQKNNIADEIFYDCFEINQVKLLHDKYSSEKCDSYKNYYNFLYENDKLEEMQDALFSCN